MRCKKEFDSSVEWGKDQKNLAGGFQNIQPAPDARHAHAQRRRQVGFVEPLPMPANDQCEKPPEYRQIVDCADTPHVPLQVGQQDGSWLSATGAVKETSCR